MSTALSPRLEGYGFTPEAINHFRSYVAIPTVGRAYEAWKQVEGAPVPFSHWRWHRVAAPGHEQDSSDWHNMHEQLRRFLGSGGILILTGRARAGKTCLLERLVSDRILDNSRSGSGRCAPVPPEDIPSGIFAIDETDAHAQRDIVRVIADMRARNRGFALVFQHPESFRDYEIGDHLAPHPVQFLDLSDQNLG